MIQNESVPFCEKERLRPQRPASGTIGPIESRKPSGTLEANRANRNAHDPSFLQKTGKKPYGMLSVLDKYVVS